MKIALKTHHFWLSLTCHVGAIAWLFLHPSHRVCLRQFNEFIPVYTRVTCPEIIDVNSLATHNKALETHQQLKKFLKKIVTPFMENKSTTKEPNMTLVKQLHKAIAAHQSYPEDALARAQTGVVKIGFTLHPDGHITAICILQASDFPSLNEAAKKAVEAISPFPAAKNYLTLPTFFSVDVIFE